MGFTKIVTPRSGQFHYSDPKIIVTFVSYRRLKFIPYLAVGMTDTLILQTGHFCYNDSYDNYHICILDLIILSCYSEEETQTIRSIQNDLTRTAFQT